MTVARKPVPDAAEGALLAGARPARRAVSVLVARKRTERSLIAGALAGSQADLEALFQRYWPRAYRAAYLIVQDHAAAEDIAQEAFLAAVRHLDRFDRRRPFGPWLAAIVANRAIDWTRAAAARHERPQPPADDAEHPPAPSGGYSQELLAALAGLSPEHRAVIVLRYVLEYTPGEIARVLDLPRGTVNSRLRRALDTLESRLAEADLR
jgi:RNA polymerase sigma-70 factor (ECF subfamily)